MTTFAAIIPTMPQRADSLRDLLGQLEAHQWLERVTVSPSCGASRKDTPLAIRRALEGPPVDWFVYMEDDAILGPYYNRIPALVDTLPDDVGVASFFSRAKTGSPGWGFGSAKNLSYIITIAIRASLLTGFDEFASLWYVRNPQHFHAPDFLIGEFIHERGGRQAVWYPSLVQHRIGPSTLGHRAHNRTSPSFGLPFEIPQGVPRG